MRNAPWTLVWVWLACLSLCGCQSSKPKPEWRRDTLSAASDRVLWEVTVLALQKEGYPVGAAMDPGKLLAQTGWRNSLMPFRGKGLRQRAEVHYERGAPGRYDVRLRVETQRNMSTVRQLDLSYAKWEAAPDDQEAALVLLQRIKSWLAPQFELNNPEASRPAPPGAR